MTIPRTSTSIALEKTKLELKGAIHRADVIQGFYDQMVEQRDKLNEQCRKLANERDEARRELHECHEVFNQLEGNRTRATLFGTESVKSLPGRLACFLAKLRAA